MPKLYSRLPMSEFKMPGAGVRQQFRIHFSNFPTALCLSPALKLCGWATVTPECIHSPDIDDTKSFTRI